MSRTSKIMTAAIAVWTLLLAATIAATPAKASTTADLYDVQMMVSVAKVAWTDLSRTSQNDICTWWYIAPREARNEMARMFYQDVFERQFSLYDSKRAATRVLNWAC